MLVLLISNLVVKVIGVMFKIPLVNIIGDDGMGYFNSAYTIYTLFYTLSTAGLPVAVSILISECVAKESREMKMAVYRMTMRMFLSIGMAVGGAMFLFRVPLAKAIGSENASHSIGAMSAVLLFVCISSGVRGYFQGHQIMTPTAVSSVIEACGKLVGGIMLSLYAIKKEYPSYMVASYAVLGITIASALSAIYLVGARALFDRHGEKCKAYKGKEIKGASMRLIGYAIPITIGSAVMSLTGVLDLSMVMKRLVDLGNSVETANAIYGNYSGIAVPMFNMPSAIIAPIALSVVPYISGAIAKNDRKLGESTSKSAVRTALILCFPCGIGMSVFSGPILRLIFEDSSANRAAVYLSVLALGIVGVGLTTVTTAVLQGYKKNTLPIVSMLCGSAVKLITGYYLMGSIGMMGTPVSTVVCYVVTSLINVYCIRKYIGIKLDLPIAMIKPCIASLISCGVGVWVFDLCMKRMGEGICCIMAIGATGALYFSLIILFGGIREEDVAVFPGGEFINKYFLKGKIIKIK